MTRASRLSDDAPTGGREMTAEAAGGKPFPAMSIEQAHKMLGQPGSMFEVADGEVHGVKTKLWKNAPPTLRDVFNLGAVFAAREHLILEDDRVTIGGLRAASA